jgi:O-antigen/teichoic acid export membrane protein
MIIAAPAIRFLYGDDYVPVISPFIVLISGSAINSMPTMAVTLFNARADR